MEELTVYPLPLITNGSKFDKLENFMRNQQISWVFFDLGATLVDESLAQTIRVSRICEMLNEIGCDVSEREIRSKMEFAATNFHKSPFFSMIDSFDISETQRRLLKTADPYQKQKERLYRYVPEVLSSLKEKYHLGIIANQPKGTVTRLRKWGINDFFKVILSSAEIGYAKPDLRIFKKAMMISGCPSHKLMMVGDRLDNDIRPAKELSWKTLQVRQELHRFQKPREHAEEPDWVVEKIADIVALL